MVQVELLADVITSSINGTFEGWSQDTLFPLNNGQYWIQTDYQSSYSYSYSPQAIIYRAPSSFVYKMWVEGESEAAQVQQVTNIISSRIDGEFNGWEGDTLFYLWNGQVWQQARWAWNWAWGYSPKVLIYRTPGSFYYTMQVEGESETIEVVRVR